jgi:hypothetical protein
VSGDAQGPPSGEFEAAEVTFTGLEDLPVQQRLAVAAHLQARTLQDWHPHVARALEAQAVRDAAEAEAMRTRAEAWRAFGALVRHPAAIGAYVLIVTCWGVGSAVWATGVDPASIPSLLPSVTWEQAADPLGDTPMP